MDSHQLAQELRSYAAGEVEREVLAAVSDEEIILLYVMCPKCGKFYVPVEWIFKAAVFADNIKEFFELTDGRLGHLQCFADEHKYAYEDE